MIRISSGWCGGMQLASPDGATTRPTASRIREAVLNSLQAQLPDARFLDLFAGSGAVGIEAVSRGASGCIFVERDRHALTALKKNVAEVERRAGKQELSVDLAIIADDVKNVMERLEKQGRTFDIIWADPPYSDTIDYLAMILTKAIKLCPDGQVVIESGDEIAPERLVGWTVLKSKGYGDTTITYLRAERS